MLGGVYCDADVVLCVCLSTRYLKNLPINFIFSEGLPSDPGRKWLDFEKNHPVGRVGVGGSKFGPNDKR